MNREQHNTLIRVQALRPRTAGAAGGTNQDVSPWHVIKFSDMTVLTALSVNILTEPFPRGRELGWYGDMHPASGPQRKALSLGRCVSIET